MCVSLVDALTTFRVCAVMAMAIRYCHSYAKTNFSSRVYKSFKLEHIHTDEDSF